MLKMMTAEITQSMGSLVLLKGTVGSDRRMKQTELILHRLFHHSKCLQHVGSLRMRSELTPFRRMQLLALALGCDASQHLGAGSETPIPPLTPTSPDLRRHLDSTRQQRPAPTSHPWPKPERVTDQGARQAPRRENPCACLRACPLQCCRLDCVINFIQLTVNYC